MHRLLLYLSSNPILFYRLILQERQELFQARLSSSRLSNQPYRTLNQITSRT